MPLLATNKKAYHDYEILETFEAGLVLTGPEVKAAKASQINLKGSYVDLDKNEEIWLHNTHISPYKPAAAMQQTYNPTRSRKLLLHKKQIRKLIGRLQQKGLTAVPLKVYTIRRLVKIEIGVGRGKKQFDKKEALKKRDVEKRIQQAFKDRF
jgi:SsrA-binding protein